MSVGRGEVQTAHPWCFSVSAREPGASQQDGEMLSLTLC